MQIMRKKNGERVGIPRKIMQLDNVGGVDKEKNLVKCIELWHLTLEKKEASPVSLLWRGLFFSFPLFLCKWLKKKTHTKAGDTIVMFSYFVNLQSYTVHMMAIVAITNVLQTFRETHHALKAFITFLKRAKKYWCVSYSAALCYSMKTHKANEQGERESPTKRKIALVAYSICT